MTGLLNLGLVLILSIISFQALLVEAKKSRCPFGFARPKPVSSRSCTTINKPTCDCNTIYRTYDGSCNNLKNPLWGVPNSRFERLLPAKYGDGLFSPRLARSGNNLPSARLVSTIAYPNLLVLDGKWTLINMNFGQFVAHDMSLTKVIRLDCCSSELASSKKCFPISVPSKDKVYGPLNIKCLPLTRSVTDKDNNCSGKWNVAEQINEVNAYLDLSPVYGNDIETAASLRLNTQGLLKYEKRNHQQWLPEDVNRTGCFSNAENCYIAGDSRLNQNPELTLLHTIYLREHNRIATKLAVLNPRWDDERLYQEARRINIAAYQAVTYNEWLPIILGSDLIESKRLAYVKATHFVNDYNKSINAAILSEHASAAYRFFHTLIAGLLELSDEHRLVKSFERISDWWLNPSLIEDNADDLIRGFTSQAEDGPDRYHTKEITIHWLRAPNASVGTDLKSIDIQRDRDHGLASYNDFRKASNLSKATSFKDFTDVMTAKNAEILASIYECPDDVDLTVGGSLETITLGQGLAGPTFKFILAEQFWKSRVGDRFFFENSAAGFTLAQLKEIRKATISRLLCDNAYAINKFQPAGFELISDSNDLVSCHLLPSIDLSLWAEK